MDMNVRQESDTAIVTLEGKMDWRSLSDFSGSIVQLVDSGTKNILLDFSKMEYMSSAGIRALIEAMQNVESKGGKLAICSPGKSIMELFQVVQLEKIIRIYKTEWDALNELM